MMKVTVVTPSFDQGQYLGEALQSVENQGYPLFEHIVLDNCSTDNTAQVLARYPRLKVICEPDHGQSDALNKGFRLATGDIIGWLNADDRYLPGAFAAVAQFMASHPEVDVLYGDYQLISSRGNLLKRRRELGFDPFMLKYLHVLYIPSTATFFRKRIFAEGNFLDKEYHYAMDYEFFLRLALKGYTFAHINAFLADFRIHPGSKSQQHASLQKKEMEQALLKHDPFLRQLPEFWQRPARQGLMVAARAKRCSLKLLQGAYFL